MLLLSPHQSQFQQATFSKPGDSGSLIMYGCGRICGLLYGSSWGYVGPPGEGEFYCNAGLTMTISDLLEEAKAQA
jgi:hypothetical protein